MAKKKKKIKKVNYPGAGPLLMMCVEEYKRLIDTYDKIYNKISIALAFCGVFMLGIVKDIDFFKIIEEISKGNSRLENTALVIILSGSGISVILIIISLIKLLRMLRSSRIKVVDSEVAREDEYLKLKENDAEAALINIYTEVNYDIKSVTEQKQIEYDKAIKMIVVALISYFIICILQKGM